MPLFNKYPFWETYGFFGKEVLHSPKRTNPPRNFDSSLKILKMHQNTRFGKPMDFLERRCYILLKGQTLPEILILNK
jgi:hypothetical protein